MASLLRQIVAGPRARHPEAGLDLCYVTDNIIATSGPSGTYPQRAYRNPLDSFVKFLDDSHGEDWAIWEFRAEGTGYPDSEVYNRVYHYPFPDHHPPPFKLIPNIMASMRNWMKAKEGRVVVVHCKAGKGRSGTVSCSYLISEEGWKVEDALKRFTERRMRPGFGAGVSIPSQLRWIGYVDRWARHGKIYVERQIEVLEVHCWDLRDGVKIEIEGFVDDGKTIKKFHTFTRGEREIIRGDIPVASGLADVVAEVMGRKGLSRSGSKKEPKSPDSDRFNDGKPIKRSSTKATNKSKTDNSSSEQSPSDPPDSAATLDGACSSCMDDEEDETIEKAGDVVFRPSTRVVLPTSDINIDVERRNKAAYGLTMVTAVAHVWFNTYFEGNGPEQDGQPDDSGVFEIEWDKMDGIKGSSRKGTRAFSKIAVVWKALKPETGEPGIVITEPGEGEEVEQTSPANWKGEGPITPSEHKDLGLRTASPAVSHTDVSKASSVQSEHAVLTAPDPQEDTGAGTRSHIPNRDNAVEPPNAESAASEVLSPTSSSSTDDAQLAEGTTHTPAKQEQAGGGGTGIELQQTQMPESELGIVRGMEQISTEDLPDGKPEEELKTASGHSLGHIKLAKKAWSSS